MNRLFTTKNLAKTAMISAVYGVVTWALSFVSYGPIQFRVTEVMVLLAFIDYAYIPGLVLGCVIANLFSPFGIVDIVFGSLATFIAVILISKTKNLLLATIWPTITNGIIVGLELYYMVHTPFLINFGEVALGEFVVVTCIGYPMFKFILKNKALTNILKMN
ncbi:QueT transporter family protein [Clostridium sp. PL3]|uniref:QueT transporter family protein n=1 Tax=Clostridium thailandense TaxID=2794346 RepID=A0A949WQH1_9CLOT|nr:QueT transporter family protein [Clostridium thailandense]MBV7272735.1 QueT transporter family protein [Clostridium thailandense]